MSNYLPWCSIQYTKGSENVILDSLSQQLDLLACLLGPTGAYDCATPAIQQCFTTWLMCVDRTLSLDDVYQMAQHALAADTTLTHLSYPHYHAFVLETTISMGNHYCHAHSNKLPHTTGTTWGNPLASLAPELITNHLHVRMLLLVLHAVLATLTNATLLLSFLE